MTTALLILSLSIQLSSSKSCGDLIIKCNNGDSTCYSGPCAEYASHLIDFNRLPFWTHSPTMKPTSLPTPMTYSPTPKPTFPIITIPFNTIKPVNYQQQHIPIIPDHTSINIITRHVISDTIITKYPTSNPTIKPTLNPTEKPTTNPSNKPSTNPTNKPTNKPVYTPQIPENNEYITGLNLGGSGTSDSSSDDDAKSIWKYKKYGNFDLEKNNVSYGNQPDKKMFPTKMILISTILIAFLFGICYKCILMAKNKEIHIEVGNEESECILHSGNDENQCIAENTPDIDSSD